MVTFTPDKDLCIFGFAALSLCRLLLSFGLPFDLIVDLLRDIGNARILEV